MTDEKYYKIMAIINSFLLIVFAFSLTQEREKTRRLERENHELKTRIEIGIENTILSERGADEVEIKDRG